MKIRRQDAPELLSRSYYWCWETIYHPSRQNNISLDCGQHQLAKSKMAAREPQIVDRVWKGVYLKVFGRSRQLLLNKCFDPSTPSMRKGRDGEKNPGKNEKKTG